MTRLRDWWSSITDSTGLTDPDRSAPPMNRRITAGGAILLSVLGSLLLVRWLIALARGDSANWAYLIVIVGILMAAVGFALEWRRAKKLAED